LAWQSFSYSNQRRNSSADGIVRLASTPRAPPRSIARGGELDVGSLPGLLEALLGLVRFRGLPLLAQGFGEPEERPAVLADAREVFPIDRLRLGGPAGGEERGAERRPHGIEPVRGLGVARLVLALDRRAQQAQPRLGVAPLERE